VKRHIHYVAAESHRGRQLAQAKGARIATDIGIPADTLEHNRKIEEARAAELAARKARKEKG
jgi:hypothetical protein